MIKNEICPVTALLVFAYIIISFTKLKFLLRKGIWNEMYKILWLKYKKYGCHLVSLHIYSGSFKSNQEASGVVLFYDASLWIYQKKHICQTLFSLLGTYEIKFVLILFIVSLVLIWKQECILRHSGEHFQNSNQIPTVLMFNLVFKGLLCWKDHRESIMLYFWCPWKHLCFPIF